MNKEPTARPTMVLNKPIKTNKGDKAEAYNFKNHKAGEGQCSCRKNRMLRSAVVNPRRAASD